jgi:acetylornithine deacetylase/succinyl-diaminopimelate desuccinylase-like protein
MRLRILPALLALAVAPAALLADAPVRPQFEITTDEAFDPSSIPAYAGEHPAVYAHIDASLERHVEALQRWVRQRSISAQNDGIAEMAELLRADLEALGFAEAEVVPTDGHPGVWGYYDAGAERTMLVYMMYDVQPVEEDDWQTPPFAGNLVESPLGTALMARGATNQKGPQRAFLNAVESIIAVDGTLPVNLMVLAEGEEELGSPHYPQLVDRFEARLKTADGVIMPFNSQSPNGQLFMSLGVKGILYMEVESRGGEHGGPSRAEIHGSYKAIVDSPSWRLVQALASLTTPDGNTITVPGYYDDVRPPTAEEMRLVNGAAQHWDEARVREALGVARWVDDMSGPRAMLEYLYIPTLNINGMWSGYTGEGTKTILPHYAAAKVDSRLPPGLSPEHALSLIRAHLDRGGFTDVTIKQLSGYPAAQSSVDSPLVRAAIGVFNKYGEMREIWPRLAGSAPFYVFTDRLGLPLVFTGLGHGSGAHAPDEYMVIHPKPETGIAGLAEIEKAYADLLYSVAQ